MLFRRMTGWPKWDWTSPFEEMERMRRRMDLLNEGLSKGLWREPSAGVFPLMNVTEDSNNYYVRAELPGIKADDLELSVTSDTLSISGERKIPAEDSNAQYHRRERDAGRFSRIITLAKPVNTEKAEARCSDGILTLILPKAQEARPKQIAVKAG